MDQPYGLNVAIGTGYVSVILLPLSAKSCKPMKRVNKNWYNSCQHCQLSNHLLTVVTQFLQHLLHFLKIFIMIF